MKIQNLSKKANIELPLRRFLLGGSPVNLLSLTVFPIDASLAGSSAGTERM